MCLVFLHTIFSGYSIFSLKKALLAYDSPNKNSAHREKQLEKALICTKKMIFQLSKNNSKIEDFAKKFNKNDIVFLIFKQIDKIENLNSQKEMIIILGSLLRHSSIRQALTQKPELLEQMFACYINPNLTIPVGILLREMIKHEDMFHLILSKGYILKLLDLASSKNYNISVDAFLIFKKSFNRGRHRIAEHLEENYREFINHYINLILSPNFLIRSQSMRLLTTILTQTHCELFHSYFVTDRSNMKLLLRFIQDASFVTRASGLKLIPIFVAHQTDSPELAEFLRFNKEYFAESLKRIREHVEKDKKFHEIKELFNDSEVIKAIDEIQ